MARFSNPGTQVGAQNMDCGHGAVLQTDLL